MNLLLHHAHFLGFFIPWPHLGKKKLKDLEWLQNTFTKLGSWHQRSILKKLRKYNPDKITVSFDEYRDGNIDYQIEKAHDEQIQHAIKHHPKDLIATALGRRFHERKAAAYRAKIRKYAIGSVLGAGALGTAGWAGRRFLIK
jgi:hypothetical protein